MDTDAKDEKPKTRKVRKQVRKDNLPVVPATQTLDRTAAEDAKEKEGKMAANDKLVAETENMKNALETYIYDVRGKFSEDEDGVYVPFSQEAEREKIVAKLTDAIVCFLCPFLIIYFVFDY